MKCKARSCVRRATLAVLAAILTGCSSMSYLKSELTGQAKPEGGTTEAVPASKTYRTTPAALRTAVLAVLTAQGYRYDENVGGSIKTEPKMLGDPSKFGFMGATYAAKLQVKLDGPTVTYRALFDKKSNITMAEQNVEYPEKENELRGAFFAELDKRLPK